jgi:hypothetical protein
MCMYIMHAMHVMHVCPTCGRENLVLADTRAFLLSDVAMALQTRILS